MDGRNQQRGRDAFWVRSALSQLEFLASGRSIEPETRSVIEFAIRWAPYGGASAGDLFVTFGVDRRRFMTLLEEGLWTRRSDSSEERWFKQRLSDALTSAWRPPGRTTTGDVRC
ncbi:hypothetical protein ACFXG4_17095 [Nocardia sp. NPDC059246]|uniref:hypothetical protein n=1 Tax=unclassified Nocardia TaxID=2637762 RepID=UPI00368EC431